MTRAAPRRRLARMSPAVVRCCHFPGFLVTAYVLPGHAALCLLIPSRSFTEVLMPLIVKLWTAPGPEIFRVYAHLASSMLPSALSAGGTLVWVQHVCP